MGTFRQFTYAVLAIATATILGASVASAAYDQDQGQQYQNQQQDQYQYQGDQYQQYQSRNLQLERQIAQQLRNQGFGQQGEIMILATGDRVILLGNVPDRDSRNGVEQAAKQVPGVQRVDNRLHVMRQARQMSDSQLQNDTSRRLPDRVAQNVRVQAQYGTVTLQGNLNNWEDAADAIDAAFAAGAQQVNSQIMVGAGTAGMGGYGAPSGAAGGYAPSYGYAPGTGGQQMGTRGQASSSDLRLAFQVAQQLRQQLPPDQNVEVVRPMSIYVTVKNGTATLHGYIQDSNQKQQAEQIARSVSGVRRVKNDLAILGGMGTAGQGMGGTQMSAPDQRLARQIQQQLQDQFPDANINVSANQGTVMLQGTVSDFNQKQQAEQIAKSMPGVQNVQNNLTVAGQGGYYPPQGYVPGQSSQYGGEAGAGGMSNQEQFNHRGAMGAQQGAMSSSDMALAQQIAQKLQQQLRGIRNVRVERPGTIYVMATQGTVMLHGFVTDPSLKQQATTIARAIPGVRNVENTLNIGAGGMSDQSGMSSQDTTEQYTQIAYSEEDEAGQSEEETAMTGAQAKAFGTSALDLAKAQQIQQSLQSQLPDADITVTVSGNNVTLWGTAADAQQKQQAKQIAQSASGISNVTDNLTVGSRQTASEMGDMSGQQPPSLRLVADANQMATTPSDIDLAQRVAQMLQEQLRGVANVQVQIMKPNSIYVMVSKGNVTLHGLVPSNNVKNDAEKLAKAVPGVKGVKNSLTVGTATGTPGQAQGQPYGAQRPGTQPPGTPPSGTQPSGSRPSGTY